MNFVLWLVKRAWKPVRDLWHDDGNGDTPGWAILCMLTGMVSFAIDVTFDIIVYPDRNYITYWVFMSLWLFVWGVMACYRLGEYMGRLHTQYRTEQPEQEKPKRKNDYDSQLEAMTNHYLSIVNEGLDLYEFKPERPTGDMADNCYALDAYTKQLIAFAQAVGINSENKDYFESVTYCDSCAKETNDLSPVAIAGIGISHQCPKCTPIIEKYERRYQEGETND